MKRRRGFSFFDSPLVALTLGALVVALGVSTVRILGKNKQAAHSLEEYRLEYEALEKQRATLERNIEKLTTDRGKEFEIRERYPVAKEGERLIVIVPEEEKPLEEPDEDPGFFWRLFGDKE